MCKRTRFLITAAVFSAIFLASCGGKSDLDFSIPEDAQAGDLQLEECTYQIEKEDYAADCGTLIVPENRADPESRLIALPVTRVRSIGSDPAEPVFHMEGGPGSSNMHGDMDPTVLANHDFVMVGYRGVDGSVVLDCPEIGQAMKGDGEDAVSDASIAILASALRQCSTRLEAEGVDLDGYAILDVVEDFEDARQALGYEKINLVSFSYGTRVAQYYAYLYPEIIYRSVMVSVNPPGHFVWDPDMIDAQLEYYSQLYAQSEDPRTADLAQTMREVSQNMPENWLGFNIDPGKVKLISFMLLYNQGTATQVMDAWMSAAEGDASGFAIMSFAYDLIVPGMFTFGEFMSKGISVDYDPTRDFAAEMDPPGSIIGSPLSKLIWAASSDEDGITWPTPVLSEEFHQVQPSAVETLLVGGRIDFSTPFEYARDELLPVLENGAQVVLAEMGHTSDVPNLQPEAFAHLLANFYDTGEVDDSMFVYEPVDFQVGIGFPEQAKIVVAVLVILLVLFVWAVWAIIRRAARAKKN